MGDSRVRGVIMETKRRFVRFISNEIRTPFNTVYKGVQLLHAELGDHRRTLVGSTNEEGLCTTWMNLIKDIQENVNVAVTILTVSASTAESDRVSSFSFDCQVPLKLTRLFAHFSVRTRRCTQL